MQPERETLAHQLREIWWHCVCTRPSKRYDLVRVHDGVDAKLTRRLLGAKNLTALEAGTLRTILVGILTLLSRLWRARLILGAEATCVRCSLRAIDLVGHHWVCPAFFAAVRQSFALIGWSPDAVPRCLSRSGVAPVLAPAGFSRIEYQRLVARNQQYMVTTTRAIGSDPAAQRLLTAALGRRAARANNI